MRIYLVFLIVVTGMSASTVIVDNLFGLNIIFDRGSGRESIDLPDAPVGIIPLLQEEAIVFDDVIEEKQRAKRWKKNGKSRFSEVSVEMEVHVAEVNPVLHFPFDGHLVDNVSGVTGEISGSAVVAGRVGKAYLFGNEADFIEISPKPINLKAGTVSVWFSQSAYTKFSGKVICHIGRLPMIKNGKIYERIDISVKNDMLQVGLGTFYHVIRDICRIQLNEWYHVVLSWEGTTCAVYVNGVKRGVGEFDGLSYKGRFFVGSMFDSKKVRPFRGTIDELKIWNRMLSDEEVGKEYALVL